MATVTPSVSSRSSRASGPSSCCSGITRQAPAERAVSTCSTATSTVGRARCSTTSSAVRPKRSTAAARWPVRAASGTCTPLGRPVVPEV